MKGYLIDDYFEELCFCDDFTFEIAAIDDKYNSICSRVISWPYSSDSFLSSKIPSTELNVIMGHLLDIASDRWCCLYSFS
jgi:hypothetical protein